MNDIAVIGGAGTVGRRVVSALVGRGRTARVLSRSSPEHPVDLITGEGLEAALTGCSVAVNASNSTRQAQQVLVAGSGRLVAAAAAAGVGHLVGVSIVGIDAVPMAYYRAKLDQEAVLCAGAVPFSIVRSTQFHELIAGTLATMARFGISPRAGAPLQPVASVQTAAVIADVASAAPTGAITTVGGPEIETLGALARAWSRAGGRHRLPLPLPLVGAAGRSLKRGGLTCPEPDHRGTTTFAAWLAHPD